MLDKIHNYLEVKSAEVPANRILVKINLCKLIESVNYPSNCKHMHAHTHTLPVTSRTRL